MATVKIKDNRVNQFGGVAAYGNVTTLRYLLATSAAGAALNSTSTAALAVGDKVDLGSLPAGFLMEDAQVIVHTGMTAAVTGSLGFVYADGVDDAKVPQDAAYFGAGLALSAAARLRADTTKLVMLPKEARLVLTIAGAANAKASSLTAIVHGERMGAA